MSNAARRRTGCDCASAHSAGAIGAAGYDGRTVRAVEARLRSPLMSAALNSRAGCRRSPHHGCRRGALPKKFRIERLAACRTSLGTFSRDDTRESVSGAVTAACCLRPCWTPCNKVVRSRALLHPLRARCRNLTPIFDDRRLRLRHGAQI
jgi:hypothetical protein